MDRRPEEPRWSPDGHQIVFSKRKPQSRNGESQSHIWVVESDGRDPEQLTRGTVYDRSPSWSADGSEIVFQRRGTETYIAAVDPSTMTVRALTAGGAWEYYPAWSPDGTSLAFMRGGILTITNFDGTRIHLEIPGLAVAARPISWSPDGRSVMYAVEEGNFRILTLGRSGSRLVRGTASEARSTQWSPDGQSVLFHHEISGGPKIYVTGIANTPAPPADCRPKGARTGVTTGFPIPESAAPSTGVVRVVVLFMDFPDAQAKYSTHDEAALGLPGMKSLLEKLSYGKLKIELRPYHTWLRAEHNFRRYTTLQSTGRGLGSLAREHAVELAGSAVDFSSADTFLVVHPSSHFSGGRAGNTRWGQSSISFLSATVNSFGGALGSGELSDASDWSRTAAHEFGHVLGLADLYRPFLSSIPAVLPPLPDGQVWTWGRSSLMGLGIPRRDDSRGFSLGSNEMISWSRWQLGWLTESQVECIVDGDATVALAPIERPGGRVAMVAVPITLREILVVESRREFGLSKDIGGVGYTSSIHSGLR